LPKKPYLEQKAGKLDIQKLALAAKDANLFDNRFCFVL
jgi:hypothetical protein